MQKTVYEDKKYSMQDTGHLYIGVKYTFEELLEEENILFKFRLIAERYLLPEGRFAGHIGKSFVLSGCEEFSGENL